MMKDLMMLLFITVAGLGVLALIAGLWLLLGQRRKRRHQNRLDIAFERARTVERTGSGLQGMPYSVYGESAWADHSRDGR